MEQREFGLFVKTQRPYAAAVAATKDALKAEGFGVLTEIDVRETIRQKLDREFLPYVIIGACNPPLAHRALQADLNVGLLLPCNVIVYQEPEGGCTVAGLNPESLMAESGNEVLKGVAIEAKAKLERALKSLDDGDEPSNVT